MTDTARCFGSGDALMEEYHDHEWGKPVRGEAALLERIILEGFQSGLSWRTILHKREALNRAFADFDPPTLAAFTEQDVTRLLHDASIVRNRRKIEAAITNARAVVALHEAGRSLTDIVWSHAPVDPRPTPVYRLEDTPTQTEESASLARDLKSHGFVFVGPVTMYAMMQACGLVNDHLEGCLALQAS